jgi:N4-(beta-N-acetylglucosaminyl)-L-asparaginase
MLVGEGARTFALEQGFQPQNLLTPRAEAAWREWLKTANYAPRINSENTDWRTMPGGPGNHDTIGALFVAEVQQGAVLRRDSRHQRWQLTGTEITGGRS